jgi:UDP-N-acetylglucosamine 2-epimerase (non-hydrolysing)
MSDVFFQDLDIPLPDRNLAIGSGRHGAQTGAMLEALEATFLEFKPDWVLVYGDTNSTLAAVIAAVKLHIPVAHLEAGLRSFNRRMPEEHNRVLTDHAAELLLAPTEVAMKNLIDEGLAKRSVLIGDVMTDVVFRIRDQVLATASAGFPGFAQGGYRIATIHRPDNSDNPVRLAEIMSALAKLDLPVMLLAHPRIQAIARQHGIPMEQGALRTTDPLPYPQLIAAVMGSAGVITDSGGLQKEAFLLRIPTTTIRTETEWVETVQTGWNALANEIGSIAETVNRPTPLPTDAEPYGDGHAAERAVSAIMKHSIR